MIVRRLDPEQPDREIYVPLAFDHEKGEWVGLVKHGGYTKAIDAGMVCVIDLRESYAEILQKVRITLALCEHRSFSFSNDGLDADMIRDMVRALTRAITDAEENLKYLLNEPRSDERIRIGQTLYQVNRITGQLEPMTQRGSSHLDSLHESPSRLLTRLIVSSVAQTHKQTGRPVTGDCIEDAIAVLQRFQSDLHTKDPNEDGHISEPIEREATPRMGRARKPGNGRDHDHKPGVTAAPRDHDGGPAAENDEPANGGPAAENDEPANGGPAAENDEPANGGDAAENDEPANGGDAAENDEPANGGDADSGDQGSESE